MPAKQVLVTAGEDEVLVDDITTLIEKLEVGSVVYLRANLGYKDPTQLTRKSQKQSKAKIRSNIAEKEFHDAPVLESLLGFESETSRVLKQWVLDLIQAS